MRIYMAALSCLIALFGLIYIFYPSWMSIWVIKFNSFRPNLLRLFGLIILAIAASMLYYIFIVK